MSRGDICWADLPAPSGSEPGLRRPVVVVQGDSFNRSRISTIVCVPLTSNLRWAEAPGNVLLGEAITGLPKDSVANVSQIVALDREWLTERVARISSRKLDLIFRVSTSSSAAPDEASCARAPRLSRHPSGTP
ncbi:MAG: type II toxin-antitoxin system PemK/MazF family toxin [Acidobacteria bacterium]|nr:type II toxin-antitoxin system PemK/MazF family toxin [Acidobacteriota bacterium]